MIDVIIPYQQTMNSEVSLKYALRSLERLTGIGDVYVVGDVPRFANNDLRILACNNAFNDDRYRDCNIYFKCKLGMEHARTERVMIMHDDNFFLSYGSVEDWPWYAGGWPTSDGGLYKQVINNTVRFIKTRLDASGFQSKWPYSDLHCAHVVDKKQFGLLGIYNNWNTPPGMCVKTLLHFSHVNPVPVTDISDLKLSAYFDYADIKQMIAGRPWFSTNDNAWNGGGLRQVMEELYPGKSRWEV